MNKYTVSHGQFDATRKQYLQENGYKGNSHAMRITNIVHLYRMKILNLKKNEGKEKKKKIIRYLLP